MKTNPARRGQQGMALLEALISILIFSFGVLGIVALQAKASQFSVDSEDRTRAAMLANEIISQMWEAGSTSDCSSIASTTISGRTELALPGSNASCSTDSSGVVTVTVTWKAPWRKSSEQSNTYVTKVVMP
ncbi:type IV pilus modification protein PilV [Uliginosibacterium paludis]|uniref:Type IV pilus modification protein PilV n=1 Tax=Uliginosibacterium paludis TaxID=1615952 RepID=A0ABV2CTM9_9RHOO